MDTKKLDSVAEFSTTGPQISLQLKKLYIKGNLYQSKSAPGPTDVVWLCQFFLLFLTQSSKAVLSYFDIFTVAVLFLGLTNCILGVRSWLRGKEC